ncbi:MobA/MobL family protein [Rickettsia fournieri]|uniref:MobA/MobL family protein n=1 Tax=Rickettsia fournieri TaxID=1436798 RepID=UPI000CDEB452|nr:MobA/MobL family protein [Rickettsia fournieri]
MASYHFHGSCIQRSKGQNAVTTAAYIAASKLVYSTIDHESGEAMSITYDFAKKKGVEYSKIFVPEGFEDVAWLQDRAQLWNAAETREKRDDATIARGIEFALPREICKEENIRLVEEFVQKNIVARGLVCDVNIHYDNPDNPHVHFQFLERRLERLENGEVIFAKVKDRELISKRFLHGLRHQCEIEINKVYEKAGLPFRVTAKSFKELGLDQEPTHHKGPAHYMKATELEAKNKEIIAENAKKIYENPEIVFGRISYTKPVFTKEDIAIALSDALMVHLVSKGSDIAKEQEAIRAFGKGLVREQVGGENVAQNIANDAVAITAGTKEQNTDSNQTNIASNNPAIEHLNKEYGEEFLSLYNQLLVSDKIELMDQKDLTGRTLYALKSRVNLELRYVSAIEELNTKEEHNLDISNNNIGENKSFKDRLLGVGSKAHEFSDEQIKAILSVCNGSDISVLEGNPGAGKTFVMREIVRQYKAAGFKVVGTGPSSVSAKVLSRNAGIKADNTSLLRKKIVESKGGEFKIDLSSKYYEEEEYLKSIGCDSVLNFLRSDVLDSKTVLIADEASMIELANMDYLAHEVLRAKAKLVLVGDNNQFTAVGMTGAFNKARKIAGGVKLTEVRRQERLEYRQATEAMGRFEMVDAIEIYRKLDVFNIQDNEEEAKTSLVTLFAKEYTEQMDSLKRDDLIAIRSIAIGAYTNEKVAEFNSRVRNELKNSGALKGAEVQISSGGRMLPLMKGDQIVFEENSLRYGISNGEVGTILSVNPFGGRANSKGDGVLRVLVHKADGNKDIIEINTFLDAFNNKRRVKLNHGYALTGYKLQGETVDRMHVYFDRSIGYEAFLVLMSRHRQEVKLHASAKELENIVYQRLDSDVEKVRNQFKINSYEMLPQTIKNEDGTTYQKHIPKEVPNWLIGLTLAVSRRANNSFAIDYRSDGVLDGNQSIIKEYLEARVRVFECHGKMREWKRDIESVGNITSLHSKILSQATNLKRIKLDDASPAIDFELELNIKDLKIDPYSIALSEAQDSFKYVIENIVRDAKGEKSESAYSRTQESTKLKAIKGVTYTDGKAHINFKELDSKDQSKIIAVCLKESAFENLKEIFEELKLEKEVLRDYASVICASYSNVVDTENADEFKKLILTKKAESKLVTESKVAMRALVREKNFSKSEDRKAQLEEQIGQIKEQLKQYKGSLNATVNKISTNLKLIQENTTFTSNAVLMGERTIQLNINYETLRKHAGHDTYKYYLHDITEKSTISNCKAYQDLMLLARDTSGEILLNRRIQKDLSSIDSYIFDNKELVELKRSDLLESQQYLSDLKQEEQVTGNFVRTLFPHYLGRIYEQQGSAVIEKWEAVKAANSNIDVQELIARVQSNPSHLGKLAGIGLGTIFGVSSSRRKSIEQVGKLGQQLLKYEESMARLKEIKEADLIKEQEQKIVVLKEELNVLGSLKASKAEEKFLSNLKTMQAGSGLNIKSFKSLIESDEVQDLLCEYYNSQNEQYTRLNATYEEYAVEYERYSKEQEQQAAESQEKVVKAHATHQAINRDVSAGTTRSNITNSSNRRKERTKVPSLRFKDVQEALTSSDIEKIFRQYAASIRGVAGAIKRSGSEISMGSLSMNLNKGTWIRHSSGKGGNIFGFVAEGAVVSKRQSLEIVAELAQLRAESNSYDYRISRVNKEQTQEQTQQKPENEWIVAQDKITNSDIFDPNKHLKGMMQHNTLEAVYAYKDANDKLLGYVVRFVGKEDGKKQTLPVTYCYNAAKDEYSWRLKGFTDKGNKPIFGIEKAICSSKTILIVEGEKAAIAASKILPDYNVVSWIGGSNAADKVNWGQLQWRDVIIWPDNDQPGFKAAEVIKDKLNKANDHIGFVSVIDPTTLKFNGSIHKDLLPEKWDLADRLPDGMTIANVKEAIENVSAAHLDIQQIQNVLQSTNASDASQWLVERNIWQEVFKGKIVNEEKITGLVANNEFKAATFFSAEESSNYVKYLEVTGKGSVAHDYLKYNSPMYQDILTSLATRDERLSESIKELNNGNNTSDIETIEHRAKLIDDTQNLYEKKALEYGGIAGTHEVYRDYLELMIKNYGESHGKVTLYENIVRDVSILHSTQLGTNIHYLPDSHHKEIARDVYSTISEWNGRYVLDTTDKNQIANSVYEAHCTLKAWEQKSYELVATSHKVYAERQKRLEQTRLADIERETERKTLVAHTERIKQDILIAKTVSEVFVALKKDQKFFVAQNGNIKYTTFNYEFMDLAEQALEYKEQELLPKLKDVVAAVERNNVFATADILTQLKDSKDLAATYKHFDSSLERHQLETQHQKIRQDKVDAKTTDEMLTAISREHEFFKSLDGKLKYPEKYGNSILSAISNAKTIEQNTLITNMHNMVVYAQKNGILNDQDILDQFNSNDSRNVLNNLSKTCQQHYVDHHNENIKQLLDDEHVMVGTKKYTCPLKYMKHEMQNNIPSFVDEKQIATTFAKVKAEVKELRLERELEHTMTMRF